MKASAQHESTGDNHLIGILWMLMTMCLFVSMDTVVKFLTESLPPLQIVWARFFFHMFWMSLVFRHALLPAFASGSLRIQLSRSACLVLTTSLFFNGLRTTDLSTATAIMFLSPIFVTLLAIPILGERVGLRRLAGVLVGFTGALIIVQPLSNGHDLLELPDTGYLLVIAAAFCNALYQIMTRHVRLVDSQLTTLLYSAVVGSAAMTLYVPTLWQTPSLSQWCLMAVVGLLGLTSHFCLIKALRLAPASVVVPYSYSALLWATLFGYLLFGDLPDTTTLSGAALIVGSGLYIFYRESRSQK